jgi:hypothetical protein
MLIFYFRLFYKYFLLSFKLLTICYKAYISFTFAVLLAYKLALFSYLERY